MDALNSQQLIAFLYDLTVITQELFNTDTSLDSICFKMAAKLDARVFLLLQQKATDFQLLASAGLSRLSRQQNHFTVHTERPEAICEALPYQELRDVDPACLFCLPVGAEHTGYHLLLHTPHPLSGPLRGILKQLAAPLSQALEHRRLRQEKDLLLEQFRAIQNASPDGMLLIDQQGRILQANPAAHQLLASSQSALRGQLLQALLWPGTRQQQEHALFLQALRQCSHWQPEHLIQLSPAEGQPRFLACSLTPVSLAFPPQFTVYLHDETRQQQSALHLKETKARFEIMSEHLQAGILMESVERRVLLSNSTFASLFGLPLSPEQLAGQDCRAGLSQSQSLFADPAGFVEKIEQIVQAGQKVLGEVLPLADGRVWERDYLPISYGTKLLGHLWVYRDISDKAKKAFEREILARFPDESPSPVMRLDTEGQIIYCNRPAMYLMYYLHQDLAQNLNGQLLELTREALSTQQKQVAEVAFGRIMYQLVLVPFPEQAYVNLYATDITDRIQAEQIALEARDQALQASAAKSHFLATMSHEIRTPLNAILGTLNLLDTTALNLQQQEYTSICRDAGQSLLFLINQVLDFSRFEAGKMQLSRHIFSLPVLVQKTLGFFRLQARQKQLELRANLPELTPEWVSGDQDRLQQILRILLDNALKFTASGSVQLDILYAIPLQEHYEVCWRVQDTGIGIPADQQDLIFESFQQVDASRTRQYGGSGLGLSIVKNLVALFEGKIWVESEVGQGTAFYLTTRLHQLSAAEQPLGHQRLAAPHQARPAPDQTEGPPEAEDFAHQQIVIAEDYPANQLLLKAYLASWPLQLHFVSNGSEAVAAWRELKPDLILMDLQMPEMDGITATRQIRQQTGPDTPAVPIVILTADAQSATRTEALAAGANDLLLKPVTQQDVLLCLKKHLSARTARPPENATASIQQTAAVSSEPPPYRIILDLLEILPLFLQQRRQEAQNMAAQIAAADFEALARLGHSLKGAGASFGFDHITQLGSQLELAARQQDQTQLQTLHHSFSDYLDWVEQTLPAQIQAARSAREAGAF